METDLKYQKKLPRTQLIRNFIKETKKASVSFPCAQSLGQFLVEGVFNEENTAQDLVKEGYSKTIEDAFDSIEILKRNYRLLK